MKQYIDKSTIVEYLKKRLAFANRLLDLSTERDMDIHLLSEAHLLEDMLEFINALEVKELQIPQHVENTCKENDDSLTSNEKELQESERIRKALVDTFKFYDPSMKSPFLLGISKKNILAWLEKPADKVEPKFKVGDWVVIKQ